MPPHGQPPYPPPQGPYAPPGQYPLGYASQPPPGWGVLCPRCGQNAAKLVKFTWWGGMLGPKLLNHHKCDACGYTFNGKTGQPNTTGIAIYTVVGLLLGVVAFFAFFFLMRRH